MSIVISAQTSLGSHPQYLPHETFAHTAPMKIPAVSRNRAGYSMMLLTVLRYSILSRSLLINEATPGGFGGVLKNQSIGIYLSPTFCNLKPGCRISAISLCHIK